MSLLSLPSEIRELIYDLVIQQSHSNIFTPGTAYTKTTCPLLYVHPTITRDLQHRLYQEHTLVYPIQEPSICIDKLGLLKFEDLKLTEMRKNKTTTLVFEMSETEDAETSRDEARERGETVVDYPWDDNAGTQLAQSLTYDILVLLDNLPSINTVKFIFWFGSWTCYVDAWEPQIPIIHSMHPYVLLDFQLNLFNYSDPDAGDGGMNWIQGWDQTIGIHDNAELMAIDLKWEEHERGEYVGREFDPSGWEDEDINIMTRRDRDFALHTGVREVCKPMYVKTGRR